MTNLKKQENLKRFKAERKAVPIPRNFGKMVKLLAMEIALGIHLNLWRPIIILVRQDESPRQDQAILTQFIEERWKDSIESTFTMILWAHGYIVQTENKAVYCVTEKAMDLLEYPDPANVFISYKRTESSAFALLVHARLKVHSLEPFVDMAAKVGDKWYDELHKRIKECDYFIVLLGRNTLKSDMTKQEIKWAIQYRDQGKDYEEKKIIPIWHSGFNRQAQNEMGYVSMTVCQERDQRHERDSSS